MPISPALGRCISTHSYATLQDKAFQAYADIVLGQLSQLYVEHEADDFNTSHLKMRGLHAASACSCKGAPGLAAFSAVDCLLDLSGTQAINNVQLCLQLATQQVTVLKSSVDFHRPCLRWGLSLRCSRCAAGSEQHGRGLLEPGIRTVGATHGASS